MPVSVSSQQEFSDADWRAVSSGDQSKKGKFDLSGLSANTTRVWTVPDKDITFMSSAGDTMTGALTITTTGATPLTLERTGSATNVSEEFKNTSGSVFAGHGAANTFAVKGDANLASSPWFSATSTLASAISLLTALGFYTGSATIADDAVANFGDASPNGISLFLFWSTSSTSNLLGVGVRIRTSSSPSAAFATSMGSTTNLAVSTSNVTGTTGVDGQMTFSATNGSLKVENRLGGTITLGYLALRIA